MSLSNNDTNHEDDLMLINAYVDGELDAAAALAFERRMAKDTEIKRAYDRVVALRKSFASHFTREDISSALQTRILNSIEPTVAKIDQIGKTGVYHWRQMAASVVVASVLASGATFFGMHQLTQSDSFDSIVAGHERSLLAASPVDVVSSDHHTVKPWFDSRIAISPPVPDLAAFGYVLEGGRVDIINGKPAPTLVYKLRQHLISLVAVPSPGTVEDQLPSKPNNRDGYTVLTWKGRGFVYSAVSDVATTDLDDFQSRWRAASKAE
jgi:anti-sigma factor RsiW